VSRFSTLNNLSTDQDTAEALCCPTALYTSSSAKNDRAKPYNLNLNRKSRFWRLRITRFSGLRIVPYGRNNEISLATPFR
jgi:hypothetical protein